MQTIDVLISTEIHTNVACIESGYSDNSPYISEQEFS